MVMGIAFWIIMLGFMSGAIANSLMKKTEHGNIFTTMAIGLIGSVLFGWLGSLFAFYRFGEPIGLMASLIGAVSLLYFYATYIRTYGYRFPPKRQNF